MFPRVGRVSRVSSCGYSSSCFFKWVEFPVLARVGRVPRMGIVPRVSSCV